MKIIAFDLGSNLALAHNNRCYAPFGWWGHLECSGDRRQRAATALAWFDEMLEAAKEHGIEVVIYERPFARGAHATRALWGLAGILEAVAMKHGFTAMDCGVRELKKWATGNGNACKADMIAAAKRMGYTGDNEHEADSFCLLKWAEENVVTGDVDE
jgi:Holliday junction resolvasome RuvABC endonuclease subunit